VQTGKASQTVKVIDGDTIDLDGVRIRLHGIDAPEKGQECSKNAAVFDCGRAAKEYLSFLLTGEDLTCEEKSKDRWNRVVAICRFGGRDISSKMVRAGWAIAYVKYSADYVDDQKFASANTLGMWAKEFETPEEWRKKRRG
jgi:endonuclease YncB( thermonuclease family)